MFVVIKQSTSDMKCRDNNFNNARLNGTTLLTKLVAAISSHDKYDIKYVEIIACRYWVNNKVV